MKSLLREGLLDEVEIHLVPVMLGHGRRLFAADRTGIELTRVLNAAGVTHLRYRVVSWDSERPAALEFELTPHAVGARAA